MVKCNLDIEKIKWILINHWKGCLGCRQEQAFPTLCNMKLLQNSIHPKCFPWNITIFRNAESFYSLIMARNPEIWIIDGSWNKLSLKILQITICQIFSCFPCWQVPQTPVSFISIHKKNTVYLLWFGWSKSIVNDTNYVWNKKYLSPVFLFILALAALEVSFGH